jgi:aspartyl-tRNA(Asn)/glutamyl-tRNA(Gln) amidotransferase subunit A
MSAAADHYLDLTVTELGRKIRAREVTPTELVLGFLGRIERFDPDLHAFVTVTKDLALQQAGAAERDLASGRDRGPLHGIPFGAKDLLSTAGIRTTWGAKPYADQIPDRDATVIRKLREAGAVLLGKCAMIELAGGMGYDIAGASLTGAARNPWDTGRWTCGSSSGSGAAVAARLLPFAIGSETWGSIVCPSSFCGITGLRPTYGRVSRHGAMALAWTMDKLGPMARSAADCEIAIEAIAGQDPDDPTSAGEPLGPAIGIEGAKRMKVGVLRTETPKNADAAVIKSFDRALDDLRRAGVALEEIKLPDFPFEEAAWILVTAEGAASFESLFDNGRVRMLADPGAGLALPTSKLVLATDYLKAMRIRTVAQKAMADLYTKWDAVVGLATHYTASPVDAKLSDYFSESDPLGGTGNLCGLPGLAVPCGHGSDGLPVAMVFMTGAFEERKALALGKLYQSVTDWHTKRPPLLERAA